MIYLIIWIHFIADFLFQTRNIAINKSTNNYCLGTHCILYAIPFVFINIGWAMLNGILHFGVDWVSSRLTSYFWKKADHYKFFGMIGIDQAIHLTLLLLTYGWMV